jgi:hypothetical protein
MASTRGLAEGNMEKRVSVAIVVRLSRLKEPAASEEELAYTDNVSAHGARVVSKHAWKPGDHAQISSWNAKTPIRGKVIYCQKLADDRYAVGLNFQERHIEWSTFSPRGDV